MKFIVVLLISLTIISTSYSFLTSEETTFDTKTYFNNKLNTKYNNQNNNDNSSTPLSKECIRSTKKFAEALKNKNNSCESAQCDGGLGCKVWHCNRKSDKQKCSCDKCYKDWILKCKGAKKDKVCRCRRKKCYEGKKECQSCIDIKGTIKS